jgi:hypothetical protein
MNIYAYLAWSEYPLRHAMSACGRLPSYWLREEWDAPKAGWASNFPAGPPDKDGLAPLVEADGGGDDAENSYYEEAADPGFVRLESTVPVPRSVLPSSEAPGRQGPPPRSVIWLPPVMPP